MRKLVYPGIFYFEGNSYWVEFPDLEGCQSFGDTLDETLDNAKEALEGYLVSLLEGGQKINPPTDIFNVQVPENAFVSLVNANLIKRSQSVKKTLTIPSWLNEMAEKKHVNFSSILQDALIDKLEVL